MLVFRAGIHKFLVRVANREDLGLPYLSRLFVRQLVFKILEHIFTVFFVLTLNIFTVLDKHIYLA